MGNSRWCPTRSGLAVGRYWCGHKSAAGAQILLLGNSQSCCGGYRGLRDWCSGVGGGGCGAYIKGLPLLCHMFQPMHLAPLGPAVTMEPASSLEVGGKGSSDCAWVGEEAVGWAGHGGGCSRKGGCGSSTLQQYIFSSSLEPFSCPSGLGSLSCSLWVTFNYPVKSKKVEKQHRLRRMAGDRSAMK